MFFLWFLDKPPRSIFFQTYLQDPPGEKNLDNFCVFFGPQKMTFFLHIHVKNQWEYGRPYIWIYMVGTSNLGC